MEPMALPIKWDLAISRRTRKYVFSVMGIPCIFNKINGININMRGIMSVINGDIKCIMESDCKKEDDLFKYSIISHSM
jgi:hypothetical protein